MQHSIFLTVLGLFAVACQALDGSFVITGAIPTVTSLSPQEVLTATQTFRVELPANKTTQSSVIIAAIAAWEDSAAQNPGYVSAAEQIQGALPTSDAAKLSAYEQSVLDHAGNQAPATNLLSLLQQTVYPVIPTQEPFFADLPSSILQEYVSFRSADVAGAVNAGRAALTQDLGGGAAAATSATTGAAAHAYTMAAGGVIAGAGVVAAQLLW